jgi:hypothetical protein
MKRFRTSAILSGVMLGLIGCSTSKPIRIPNSESFELKGDEYWLVLDGGETHRIAGLYVKNDSVHFEGKSVHIKEIKRLETRSFSPLRTVGLVAGIGSLTAAVGVAYLYYLFAYERASEK